MSDSVFMTVHDLGLSAEEAGSEKGTGYFSAGLGSSRCGEKVACPLFWPPGADGQVGMQIVADELAERARIEPNDENADAFGRSAFNRYYYAAFLIVREMLRTTDPEWAKTGHKSIPELLNGKLADKVRREIAKLSRAGIKSLPDASALRRQLNEAVSALSSLLSEGYRLRKVADYQPEVKVKRNSATITLENGSLDSARSWPKNANIYSKQILKVWKQLGISG
jgi:uncharacterized protein (UPF0332 family)